MLSINEIETKFFKMTKIDAIKEVIRANGGVASWSLIYDNVAKHYPKARQSKTWQAGLRGVLYRDIKDNKNLKKVGLGLYALRDYQEEQPPRTTDTVRMHSFIEGICVELGNFKDFLTYTADPSAVFRDNINLGHLTSLKILPDFTYPEIVAETKRIDVVWINKTGFGFPQRVFEIVDSVNTLTGALNRSLQLLNFRTEYYIVAPQRHKDKYDKKIALAPYNANPDKFKFVSYDKIIDLYENATKTMQAEKEIFDF